MLSASRGGGRASVTAEDADFGRRAAVFPPVVLAFTNSLFARRLPANRS